MFQESDRSRAISTLTRLLSIARRGLPVPPDQMPGLIEDAQWLLRKALAPPQGLEPQSSQSKCAVLPLNEGGPGWFALPLALRQRWWCETDYGKLAPSAELAAAIGLAPAAGFEPASPE